jgi:hypothetical protein
MTEETFSDLTLIGLRVRDFMRVKLVELKPDESGTIELRGANAMGKTSVIWAIWAALGGGRVSPDRPIKEGAEEASVMLDFGEIMVKRTWDETGTKLEVRRTIDGTTIKSPQKLLDKLVSQFVDPCQFLALRPEDQAEQVLAMTGLAEPLGELDEKEERVMEVRRNLGRDHKRAEAAYSTAAADLPKLDTAAPSISEAADALKKETDYSLLHSSEKESLDYAVRNIERLEGSIKMLAEEIEARKKEIVVCQEELPRYRDAKIAHAKYLADNRAPDLDGVKKTLDVAESQAGAVAAHKTVNDLNTAANEAKELHESANADVEVIRSRRAEILEGAEFPVAGMSYDADAKTLMLGTVSFTQASSAEQLKASIELAIAGSPGIKLLFVRDASLLDSDSLGVIRTMAAERGYQVILEIVDEDPDGPGVFIEDGCVREQSEPNKPTPKASE